MVQRQLGIDHGVMSRLNFGFQVWWPFGGIWNGRMAIEMCENRLGVEGWGSGSQPPSALRCKPANEMTSKISCNQLDSYSDAASCKSQLAQNQQRKAARSFPFNAVVAPISIAQ